MSTNLKTSLQVPFHLPEFVRDENPKFVAFMQAYYEFLENQENGDITTKSKMLRYATDPDEALADFEKNFFDTYLALIPRNVAIDKATLIKNILPLYKAKGTPKAFQFLFRILFNEDVEVILPKNDILRASDGKWTVENLLRILKNSIYTLNTGDGTTKTFLMPQTAKLSEIDVYVNGVLITTGYNVQTEYRKLNFDTAPSNGAEIKVYYKNPDILVANNRRVVGQQSGAYAVVEKEIFNNILGEDVITIFINSKTLVGSYQNGEEVRIDMLLSDGNTIPYFAKTLSTVKSITVSEGGANYNVGDPVIITGGGGTTTAAAIVDKVYRGLINRVIVNYGGAGFQDGAVIEVGAPANAILSLAVSGVDTSGNVSANTLYVHTDIISNFSSTLISSSDYGFASAISENVNTVIADALSVSRYTDIGPITNVSVLTSLAPLTSLPPLNTIGAAIMASGAGPIIDTYGTLGRIEIDNRGHGYEVGDEVHFTNKPMNFGIGAAAAVTSVSSNGQILKVEFQPERIRGTANISSPSNVTIIGTDTNFTEDLRVGDRIMINSESRYVNAIHSSTSLNVNSNFVYATTAKKVGVHGRRLVGGQGYTQDKLPTLTVVSANVAAQNASIRVSTIMGDGESLTPRGNTQPGQIESILVVSGGAGYVAAPAVDLSRIGDGTATANATLETPYVTLGGKWTTSDSILSSSDRRIQGSGYYHDYSYVLSAQVEFSKYKDIVRELLHPAGMAFYGEYAKLDDLTTNIGASNLIINTEISGTVNVGAGDTFIYGTNTRFELANNNYILIPGATIAVNSEIRTVNAIIDNTTITVTEAFTYNANVQSLVVISVPYNGLGTEDELEITTENDFVIRV